MPGQIGFAAVAAAVEEAADAAEGQADRHARRDQVGHRQDWQTLLADERDETEHRADESAEDHQAAFGDVDDFEDVSRRFLPAKFSCQYSMT